MVFSALSQNLQDSLAQECVPNAKCPVDAQSNRAHLLARQQSGFYRLLSVPGKGKRELNLSDRARDAVEFGDGFRWNLQCR